MQSHSNKSGPCAYDVLTAFANAQRALYPPQVEAVLLTDRAVNHEPDADLREEQALAAAVSTFRAHMGDFDVDPSVFTYAEARCIFTLALNAYRSAGGAK